MKLTRQTWHVVIPIAITVLLVIQPAPPGLARHGWVFFSIFAGTIAGLILEPFPFPAVGVIGTTVVALLGPWSLFSAKELSNPKFKPTEEAIKWLLSGWSSSTVWLVFTAFTFALGYEKSGLGRRIALALVKAMGRRTLFLGYAVMLSDAILAPFTASNTARSAGTIFPIVRNIPPLFDSKPHDPSARKIGGYLMWVAFATTGVTSSLFLTALAPNVLCIEIIRKTANIDITWAQWFKAAAPFGIVMLAVLPLLVYWIYPPELKVADEVPRWASKELEKMGKLTWKEIALSILVLGAMCAWIFGADVIQATTVALVAVSAMIALGIVRWEDIAGNKTAWNTIVLLALLVSMAEGLARVGFIKWFDDGVAAYMHGFSPIATLYVLVAAYFLAHYMFASTTAHSSGMLPVMLAVGMSVPNMPVKELALLLAISHGVMGVITPYATGPAPVYYGAGYIPGKDFWKLGAIFGVLFLVGLLGISAPIMLAMR
jgi:L-tartrate/succinate antiporter